MHVFATRAANFLRTDHALLALAAASALMLAGAHAFEAAGYAPCELCFRQREAHWWALAVGLLGFAVLRVGRTAWTPAILLGGLGAIFVASTGLAAYHAGVEWKFWEGPQSCSGELGALDMSDIADALAGGVRGPSCTEAAWRLFGISMAGYNALISAGLASLAFFAAWLRRPAAATAAAENSAS